MQIRNMYMFHFLYKQIINVLYCKQRCIIKLIIVTAKCVGCEITIRRLAYLLLSTYIPVFPKHYSELGIHYFRSKLTSESGKFGNDVLHCAVSGCMCNNNNNNNNNNACFVHLHSACSQLRQSQPNTDDNIWRDARVYWWVSVRQLVSRVCHLFSQSFKHSVIQPVIKIMYSDQSSQSIEYIH